MHGYHANIPVFVPHLACPNDCVFCNQRRISGTTEPIKDVYGFLSGAASELDPRFTSADIAFFGGSFTGIGESEMRRYLGAAKRVRDENPRITGIRLSTRPDYISSEILEILKEYGVTDIEIGAQSFCADVLLLSRRGHSPYDIRRASELIKKHGFSLVLQLMTGLPGDTLEKSLYTACEAATLKPGAVRIYPCVVVKDTALADMTAAGTYTPLTVEEAVLRASRMAEIILDAGIRILRIGLHSSDLVSSGSVIAGGFHPALGEMVISRLYLSEAERQLREKAPESGKTVIAEVGRGCTSKMNGQKRSNIIYLENKYGIKIKTTETDALPESVRFVAVKI